MTMTLIATSTVPSGGAASIEFTGIPQDGTDLLLVLSGRFTTNTNQIQFRANNSTGFSYSYKYLEGSGSSAYSGGTEGDTQYLAFQGATGSSQTANTFGSVSIYIPNYTSAVAKSASVDAVTENNATAALQNLTACRINLTTGLTVLTLSGGTFAQYSTASLYKITKA